MSLRLQLFLFTFHFLPPTQNPMDYVLVIRPVCRFIQAPSQAKGKTAKKAILSWSATMNSYSCKLCSKNSFVLFSLNSFSRFFLCIHFALLTPLRLPITTFYKQNPFRFSNISNLCWFTSILSIYYNINRWVEEKKENEKTRYRNREGERAEEERKRANVDETH